MRRRIIRYSPLAAENARKLRKKSTTTEILLWRHLKKKQMLGFDFHRQKAIDVYIVDFFCPELSLAIEIDGISHAGKEMYDSIRQAKLEKLGVHFLRFDDDLVFYNMEKVLAEIEKWIRSDRRV